jgi:hypothetical protein
VLERWTREWADAEGVPVARVQRSVSYMVIAAMLDTVRGADGEPLFLIKGGVAMELRLALRARATQDLDAAFRAAAEEMIERLDDALEAGHADFTASRTTAQEIGETRAIRVGVKLAYRGRPWATVPLEISSAEGRSGSARASRRRRSAVGARSLSRDLRAARDPSVAAGRGNRSSLGTGVCAACRCRRVLRD